MRDLLQEFVQTHNVIRCFGGYDVIPSNINQYGEPIDFFSTYAVLSGEAISELLQLFPSTDKDLIYYELCSFLCVMYLMVEHNV